MVHYTATELPGELPGELRCLVVLRNYPENYPLREDPENYPLRRG